MAIAYHRARGEGQRTRLIGRERGYHGVNFGGISVGGIAGNRKTFGPMLGGVDHLRHTHDLKKNAFSRGMPEHGAELADDLERIVALHDASTIAAVIVEPVAMVKAWGKATRRSRSSASSAPCSGRPRGEGIAPEVGGVAQVVDAGRHRPEGLAVARRCRRRKCRRS